MVIRLGRNGRFLACSMYPEHKETRPLPGRSRRPPPIEGVGEPCPQCGQGTLVAKRGRFGAFAGLLALPGLRLHPKTGPPPPEPLPFEVECPKCGQGHLVARRARRTGSSSGAARAIRSATSPRRASRSAPCTTRTPGPSRATARKASACAAARSVELPEVIELGLAAAGRPAEPGCPRAEARRRVPLERAGGGEPRARGARRAAPTRGARSRAATVRPPRRVTRESSARRLAAP